MVITSRYLQIFFVRVLGTIYQLYFLIKISFNIKYFKKIKTFLIIWKDKFQYTIFVSMFSQTYNKIPPPLFSFQSIDMIGKLVWTSRVTVWFFKVSFISPWLFLLIVSGKLMMDTFFDFQSPSLILVLIFSLVLLFVSFVGINNFYLFYIFIFHLKLKMRKKPILCQLPNVKTV